MNDLGSGLIKSNADIEDIREAMPYVGSKVEESSTGNAIKK